MCGPASVRLAALLSGIDIPEKTLAKAMKVKAKDGVTSFDQMVKGAEFAGLIAMTSRDLSLDELETTRKDGAKVILCWMTSSDPKDYGESGHFSVLREVDNHYITLLDTQLGGWISKTTRENFDRYWIDVDDDGEINKHWSMVCWNPNEE